MFELEILNILNEYKNASEYSRPKLKETISKLISEHEEQMRKLLEKGIFDDHALKILRECENTAEQEEDKSDFQMIKQKFTNWRANFLSNENKVNEDCQKIVNEIVMFYMPHRYETLKKVLAINDSAEFEEFKNHIRNTLRTYMIDKVTEYRKREDVEKLGFFKKRKIHKKILEFYKKLGEYNFDVNMFEEIVNG